MVIPAGLRRWTVVAALVATSMLGTAQAFAAQGDCSQPLSNGTAPTATDCLWILNAAVLLQTCTPQCICAPSGELPISATDALFCLQKAVGQPITLNCPCGSGTSTSTTTSSTRLETTTTVIDTTTTTLSGGLTTAGICRDD
jgi:hypothetical protein